ncbi:hypothetical protein COW80_02795 [Candidatus Beckwithbacteria bacterium CG22_combo_CG10-13_8_21_14_all_01_47_9]|uniref:TNase-like domain-containing protein n=5 Tax=Candidatus Beckwithiibacteriota TaxID=1752726 RepID=A0A2H0E2D5_9BACT|nr:MAG: hypothetical protein AUJ59_00510 [Candidatus Beckwithbacteria bacterium CG1_02_47_37]PIP51719.1 MAG: hypothetical protein COX09_05575 [Candidatus Beckwithbacteria bacterium CG23_combo_of_CG06-09_8_20_14_all_47_9]PIP87980.1 MAG: hypothetical protein COW80_02795 [Candidatus Beckwithbacteria bacterium CG22_combo_CG10-13_8_21_14_all_01_47_9]PJA22981.1 MAG: hypothetical protein COX59_01555 [Candidatus Beckwithbacteria bacterium CG_4_10_14_0_2_um_filter_47_25]
MPKKTKRFSKLKTAGLIAAAAGAVGLLGVSFGGRKPINVPAYRAEKVIDGDTFDTEEHQAVRLAAVDASELDECGGKEAKEELERLILNQDIYLKVIWHDSSRQTAFVYTKNGSVDEAMLASGWGELHGQSYQPAVDKQKLALASQKAQKEKMGLFSEQCTQSVNPKNPNCAIKGNSSDRNGTKIYFFPGCQLYNKTYVQPHHNDQWFCTEAAAKKAGFTKAERCPERYEPTRLNLEGYQTK